MSGDDDVHGVADAEFQEHGKPRPCVGVVEVPIESIDGTTSVGSALKVRGRGDAFVVLEVGDKHVRVRADQLRTALQSLEMLVPFSYQPRPMPPFPIDGAPIPPPPFMRRGRGHI